MGHHAACHILRLGFVAGAAPASTRGYTQVPRINKADKLPTLACQECVGSLGVRTCVLAITFPFRRKFRTDVSLVLNLFDVFRVVAGLAWGRIPTVTRGAGKTHSILVAIELVQSLRSAIFVHRLDWPMASDTTLKTRRSLLLDCGSKTFLPVG